MTGPVHLAIAGPKGSGLLAKLIKRGIGIGQVHSYRQKGDPSNGYGQITDLCNAHGIQLENNARFIPDPGALIFFVGWQFLVHGEHKNMIVFHDSLLPRHRGFNPTVNALINGDSEIGVTGFKPDGGVDTGPIVANASAEIPPFTRIADALEIQTGLIAALICDIDLRWRSGLEIEAREQIDDAATYSIWRDEDDYKLDFNQSSEQLLRHIRAVGWPYAGARACMSGEEVVVRDGELAPDLNFPLRTPGKVWRRDDGAPVVVCGSGLLKLTDLRTPDNKIVFPSKLRTRFT